MLQLKIKNNHAQLKNSLLYLIFKVVIKMCYRLENCESEKLQLYANK